MRAWASTGLPSLNDAANNTNTDVLPSAPLSADTASWIGKTLLPLNQAGNIFAVSLPPMGAVVGSCLSSITLNFMGRKNSIILSGVIFFLSFLLLGLASIPSSVEMILIGRALSGLGVGLAVPSSAIYVAECSSPALRGMLSCMPAFLMAFGVLIGYAFGMFGHFVLREVEHFIAGIFLPWHHLAYFCCAPAVLLVLSMMFLPDTPPYLVRNGQTEKATKSLAWLRGTTLEAVRYF